MWWIIFVVKLVASRRLDGACGGEKLEARSWNWEEREEGYKDYGFKHLHLRERKRNARKGVIERRETKTEIRSEPIPSFSPWHFRDCDKKIPTGTYLLVLWLLRLLRPLLLRLCGSSLYSCIRVFVYCVFVYCVFMYCVFMYSCMWLPLDYHGHAESRDISSAAKKPLHPLYPRLPPHVS